MLKWFYSLKSDHKGAVTVFITLILIPSIAFTGFFVDFARVKLYKQQAVSTADVYANSLLSYYNGLLQDIYGLYGISNCNTEEFNKTLQSYAKTAFNPNEYSPNQTNVEKLLDKFINSSSTTTTGFMPYANADVSFNYSKVDNMNLGNPTVLANQIADYSKYSVPIMSLKSLKDRIKDDDQDKDDTTTPSQDTENTISNEGDDLLDSIDDKSTSPDSKLLNKKNELDKQLQNLSSKCKEYYNKLVQINGYTDQAVEIQKLRDSILNIINDTNDNLIEFINAKNEEYAILQNEIIDIQNQINDIDTQLQKNQAILDSISNETKEIYQKNVEIKEYNDKVNGTVQLENFPNKEEMSSFDYKQLNKEYELYNALVEEYNKSNSDKAFKIEYEVNPDEKGSYNKLESLYNTIEELINTQTDLKNQITPKTTKIDSIKQDIQNKIENTGIKKQIESFILKKISLKNFQTYLEDLNNICNSSDGNSIVGYQGQVKNLYNECQTLLKDENLSEEVKSQVISDLSQIEPLITYKFDSLTKSIVDTNKKVLQDDLDAMNKYLDNNGKGFIHLLEYCKNPIPTDVAEMDSNGNVSKYVARKLDKSNYDEQISYEFGTSYVNMKEDQNKYPKISLINIDSNGTKSSEEIGIFDYLKRSYTNSTTSTDSKLPTSEDGANNTADQKKNDIMNQLNSKVDEIKQKLCRSIPNEYWNEFSNPANATIDGNNDKNSLNMNFSEKFNFDNIKQNCTNLLDKYLLEEYDYRMFSNFTTNPNLKGDKKPQTLSYVPIDTNVNYLMNSEFEYIYAGQQSAQENFTIICAEIFGIRFALDFISTYKIQEINSLIGAIRDSVSAVATPVVGVLVAGIVRVAVAMMMGVSDVIRLLSSDENNNDVVVLQKNLSDLSAYDSIKGIFESFTGQKMENNSESEKRGFSLKYTDYLRLMMLIFVDTNVMATRTGNLIELNMNNYISGANADGTDANFLARSFKMSDTQTMINAQVSIKTDFLFTNFFLTDDFIPNQDTKNSVESFTKQGYSYILKKGY